MDERIMQFRVGVMVLATVSLTVILALIFNELPTVRGYVVYIEFEKAPGITGDTPVRKSGVLIGRVTEVDLLDKGGVIVSAKIKSHRKLFQNEMCRADVSALGDATLQFVLAGQAPGPEVGDGAYFRGYAAPGFLEVVADVQSHLAVAVGSVSRTSDEILKVAERLNKLLGDNDGRISRIFEQIEGSLEVIQSTMRNTNDLIDDPQVRDELKKAIANLPSLLQDTQTTVNRMRQTFDGLDRNLRNVEDFTRPLGEKGDRMVTRLDNTLQNLDTLVLEVTKFAESLNSSEGTLGQLIHNRDLYDNVSRVALRLDELTLELRPILRDARVFTDKIARHPESLGVRGALDRRPAGIK